MKAVLLSIQPKYCELIASGKKTIEVRKTRPKIDTPFKCYIYCTKIKNGFLKIRNAIEELGNPEYRIDGKVIGEFVCDNMLHSNENAFIGNKPLTQYVLKSSCLTMEEINQYRQGKNIYAWHISDLKIYDKPKDLSEFYTYAPKYTVKDGSNYSRVLANSLKRPPQSWCYVERLGE